MDKAGVDMQILSGVSHIVQELPPESVNRVFASAERSHWRPPLKAHPDRFKAFATLPMSDPKAAVAELSRAVEELGLSVQ